MLKEIRFIPTFLNDNHRRDELKNTWCYLCKQEIKTNYYYSVDINTFTFRWDDDCYAFHKECFHEWLKQLKLNYNKK